MIISISSYKSNLMNRVYAILVSLMMIGVMSSCKQDGTAKDSTAEGIELAASQPKGDQFANASDLDKGTRIVKNMRDKITGGMAAQMKADAEAILAYRWKQTNKKSWTIMTNGFYEYEFVYNGREMSKPGEHAGRWVKFKDDLSYTYGYYDEVQGSGKYDFNLDSELLLMVDDNSSIKPNEYTCKPVNDVCILVGTEVYKDNNFQCKMSRVDRQPSKS